MYIVVINNNFVPQQWIVLSGEFKPLVDSPLGKSSIDQFTLALI